MKIIAVDADCGELARLDASLKAVFPEVEVVSFDNALKSYRYFADHKQEIALIFFPLTMKPFDGFKYSSLLEDSDFNGGVVFTTQHDNGELRELIRLNGAKRHIPKPVTPEKVRELVLTEQELCLDRLTDYGGSCRRTHCIYHWCPQWNENKANADIIKEEEK